MLGWGVLRWEIERKCDLWFIAAVLIARVHSMYISPKIRFFGVPSANS